MYVGAATTQTDNAVVLDQQVGDVEAAADFGARPVRGTHEDLVEDRAPRGVGDGRFRRARRAHEGEGIEVEDVGVDGRAAGGSDLIEQPPPP